MTTFQIYIGNHFDIAAESLSDHVVWLSAGLKGLGHEVKVMNDGHDLSRDHLNIMWEHFIEAYPQAFKILNDIPGQKPFRYAIIATEHFDGEGFNFKRDAGWKQRWLNFTQMAQNAEFIWTYFESDVKALAERFNKPTALLELGYCEELIIPKPSEAFIDFSFFGSHNAHRLSILDRLQTRGYKVYCPEGIVPREAIDGLIAHTKINIDAKGPNRIPMPSTARIGRIIHARRGLAIEYTPMQPRPSCFIRMQKKEEDFIDYCEELINSDWQKKADETFELYKQTMPMSQCVERALDQVM